MDTDVCSIYNHQNGTEQENKLKINKFETNMSKNVLHLGIGAPSVSMAAIRDWIKIDDWNKDV